MYPCSELSKKQAATLGFHQELEGYLLYLDWYIKMKASEFGAGNRSIIIVWQHTYLVYKRILKWTSAVKTPLVTCKGHEPFPGVCGALVPNKNMDMLFLKRSSTSTSYILPLFLASKQHYFLSQNILSMLKHIMTHLVFLWAKTPPSRAAKTVPFTQVPMFPKYYQDRK